MKLSLPLLLGLMLAATGCQSYSTVRVTRPVHHSPTPAGERIVHSLKRPSPPPLVRLGGLLDAASSAADVLANQPADRDALEDYNFAVARIFGIIHRAVLEPWKTPLSCPGAARVWNFSIDRDSKPGRNPSDFDIRPADTLISAVYLVVSSAPLRKASARRWSWREQGCRHLEESKSSK